MAVHILTVRILTDGEVTAVKQKPFLVLADGESREQGEVELWRMAERLADEAEELQAGRHDPEHRRHHWWMP